jgi:hypothetical protein
MAYMRATVAGVKHFLLHRTIERVQSACAASYAKMFPKKRHQPTKSPQFLTSGKCRKCQLFLAISLKIATKFGLIGKLIPGSA